MIKFKYYKYVFTNEIEFQNMIEAAVYISTSKSTPMPNVQPKPFGMKRSTFIQSGTCRIA
jgi:hypothetical protein